MSYIHVVEYYLTTEKNEVPVHATDWMTLEYSMLYETNQT